MARRAPEEAEQPGAPMYMLSFGDMMTNLLCFFVLLCAFAEEQRAGFISDGIGSFQRALMSHGLPGIFPADRLPLDLGANRVMFRPARSIAPKELVDREGFISEANRDSLRDVIVESLVKPGTTEIPVPFIFDRGLSALTEAHRAALRAIAPQLAVGNYEIRVEGFAYDEGLDFRDEWSLAVRRAENVLSYLAESGDIPLERLVPYGYGPPARSGDQRPSVRQERHGRRIVLLSLVRP